MDTRQIFIGLPFAKESVGVRHHKDSDVIDIYYCHQKLGEIDLKLTRRHTMVNLYSGRVTEFM